MRYELKRIQIASAIPYSMFHDKVGEDGKGKPIFEKDIDKQEWWINSYEVINGLIDNIIEEVEDE